jgi:hypothetical protein
VGVVLLHVLDEILKSCIGFLALEPFYLNNRVREIILDEEVSKSSD